MTLVSPVNHRSSSKRITMPKPRLPSPEMYTQKKKAPLERVDIGPCLVCGDTTRQGNYAQFEGGGVCNKTCMQVQDLKPRYPGHSEEAFLKHFNLE